MKLPRLREVRELRGWSQGVLAEKADVSRDSISNYETGHREAYPATARKLADALDVTIADLIEPAQVEELVGAGKAEAGAKPASEEEPHYLNEETVFSRAYTPEDHDDVEEKAREAYQEARQDYQYAILSGEMRLGMYDDGETIEVRLEPIPPFRERRTSRLGLRKLDTQMGREKHS